MDRVGGGAAVTGARVLPTVLLTCLETQIIRTFMRISEVPPRGFEPRFPP
jgi:hypothetical protein